MKKLGICIFLLVVGAAPLFAQSNTNPTKLPTNPTPKAKTKQTKPQTKTTLDTEESFKYLGNQLLFQMKKRLNLTSEEEEKKQDKSAENKKFSFFGIEIEKG